MKRVASTQSPTSEEGAGVRKGSGTKALLARKQNVFDDFIAAAEYLIKEKYTSTPKLASRRLERRTVGRGSHDAASRSFRSDAAGSGVMDMLRFQKFTNRWA